MTFNIKPLINNLKSVFEDYEKKINTYKENEIEIRKNETLSEYGKTEALKIEREKMDQNMIDCKKKVEKVFTEIENKAILDNKTDDTVKMSTINTIVAMGDQVTPDIIDELLTPIKHDIVSLKQIKKIFDKLSLGEVVGQTETFKVLTLQESYDRHIKNAKETGLQAVNSWSEGLGYSITKQIALQELGTASDTLDSIFSL